MHLLVRTLQVIAKRSALANVNTSMDDCRHIACATINKVDYLVSWNFKHIVNVFRIRGYNAINIKNGYIPLDIRSPKDIIINEN